MSGLSHHPGKVAQGLPCREFESLSPPIISFKQSSQIPKTSLSAGFLLIISPAKFSALI